MLTLIYGMEESPKKDFKKTDKKHKKIALTFAKLLRKSCYKLSRIKD